MTILELLADDERNHSEFQMDNFITNSPGATRYGQYKQALRELRSRFNCLRDLSIKKQLLAVDIDELEAEQPADVFSSRRRSLKLLQLNNQLDDIQKSASDTVRELRRFYSQAAALRSAVGQLTVQKRAEFEADMWKTKLRFMCATDLICGGGLSPQTNSLLQSCPAAWRRELFAEVNQELSLAGCGRNGPLLSWLESFDNAVPVVPERSLPSDAELLSCAPGLGRLLPGDERTD